MGDLDQALHLWQYTGGYESVDHAQISLSKDEVIEVSPPPPQSPLDAKRTRAKRSSEMDDRCELFFFTELSATAQRKGELLEIASPAVSAGVQLLAADGEPKKSAYVRDTQLQFEARYNDRVGKQLG